MNPFNAFISRSRTTTLLASVLLLALLHSFPACKKVDQHANLIDGQPYIITDIGLGGLFNIGHYLYRQSFLVGDTATLVGKLFLDQSGNTITLGNRPVSIFTKAKISTRMINSRTGQMDSLEVCRFLVTKDMAGNNLPLTLSANGSTVQGPPVTVLFISGGNRRTDTTQVVDKLGTWLPANGSAFQQVASPFVNNASVAGDGTIYFDNMNGLFRLANGQVSPVLVPGRALTDQSQHSFTIDMIVSSVITMDGKTLYFSSVDSEHVAPAADSLYIARLCTMDMSTQAVTTLNRTTLKKDYATYTEDPGPYNGNIGALKIVANNLYLDIYGNVFFNNFYFPENTAQNPSGNGQNYNSTTQWYPKLQHCNNNNGNANRIYGILGNICRLDNAGHVTSLVQTDNALFRTQTFYTTPGPMLSDFSNNFLPSPDGNIIYGLKMPARFIGPYNLNQYDRVQEDIENFYLGYDNTYNFISYDTAAATRLPSSSNFPAPGIRNSGNFWTCLMLPNNDILFSPIVAQNTTSLYAYNMSNKTVYCYAGTEKQNLTVQVNDTGYAKFVNFMGKQLRFCGLDRQGSVYYCIGGASDPYARIVNDYANGVRFYKLHQRGK